MLMFLLAFFAPYYAFSMTKAVCLKWYKLFGWVTYKATVNNPIPIEDVATLRVYASRFSNHTAGSRNFSMQKYRNTGWNFSQISMKILYFSSECFFWASFKHIRNVLPVTNCFRRKWALPFFLPTSRPSNAVLTSFLAKNYCLFFAVIINAPICFTKQFYFHIQLRSQNSAKKHISISLMQQVHVFIL